MRYQHKPLADQVVVVVGASSGIGRATVVQAVQRGARVVACSRGEEALATLAGDVTDASRLETMVGDAADPQSMRDVASRAVGRFGRIDTWSHVAGVVEYARFEDHTPEEFRQVVEVDLLGPVHGAMAALPHLRREGGGAYIVVSSMVAKRSLPLASAYSAAKHGVNGFVEALRVELQHEKVPISVTEVQPAAIDTPFFEHAKTRLGVRPSGPPPVYSPEKVARTILRSAERPRREVVVGSAAAMQLLLQRISPHLMDAFCRATAFRLQRSQEAKGPEDSNFLYGPVEGDDRVHGEVTTLHR